MSKSSLWDELWEAPIVSRKHIKSIYFDRRPVKRALFGKNVLLLQMPTLISVLAASYRPRASCCSPFQCLAIMNIHTFIYFTETVVFWNMALSCILSDCDGFLFVTSWKFIRAIHNLRPWKLFFLHIFRAIALISQDKIPDTRILLQTCRTNFNCHHPPPSPSQSFISPEYIPCYTHHPHHHRATLLPLLLIDLRLYHCSVLLSFRRCQDSKCHEQLNLWLKISLPHLLFLALPILAPEQFPKVKIQLLPNQFEIFS